MKFKVGDIVRVKSRQWYMDNRQGNFVYNTTDHDFKDYLAFEPEHSVYCGRTAIIKAIHKCEECGGHIVLVGEDSGEMFNEHFNEWMLEPFSKQLEFF